MKSFYQAFPNTNDIAAMVDISNMKTHELKQLLIEIVNDQIGHDPERELPAQFTTPAMIRARATIRAEYIFNY